MKRALIVIDVQNEYVSGKLPICSPDLFTSMPNIEVAMDKASDAGIPLVVVTHVEDASSPLFARGSSGAGLHEIMASRTRRRTRSRSRRCRRSAGPTSRSGSAHPGWTPW